MLEKKFNNIVEFRLNYLTKMTTTAPGISSIVGLLPNGYYPKRKLTTPLVNQGSHVGVIHLMVDGTIVIMSSIQGVGLTDLVEIGAMYISS